MFYSGIADEAGRPLGTQIRAHKELGWDHVELRQVNETTLAYASDEEFENIRAKLDREGLQVSCFAGQVANWARDIQGPLKADVDELQRAIPRMQKMNIPFIRIMSWANKAGVSDVEWRREAIRRLKELARLAEDGGVTLVHENCDGWGGLGPKQTLEMLSEVNSPALKLVFDTGNPVEHKQDSFDYFSQVKEHVVYVHIKDARPEGAEVEYTWPGEGEGRVREILSDLIASGYDGGISIEPHLAAIVHAGSQSAPEEMYNTYVEYGRRLMALMAELRSPT